MIRHAVIEGLQGFLMKGAQPAGALLLQLAPQLVDVNVHPAKREIRFRNSREVHRFLVSAVSGAVRRHQERVRSELFTVSAPEAEQRPAAPMGTASIRPSEPSPSQQVMEPTAAAESYVPPFPQSLPGRQGAESPSIDPAVPPEEQPAVGGLTLIGQFLSLYLLCERDGQLVVIDQHAAHERILFQRLRDGYLKKEIPSQALLFPVTVELGPDHAATLEQEADAVASLGVQADFFGDSTWVIKGVPALVGRLDPREILMDILDGLAGASDSALPGVVPEHIDNLLASMACKAAIKAGNRLQPEEMVNLLQQMEQSEVFSHCPHGRPVIKTFSPREIEGWFHRT
jgi:DNA mismatch repair protein MutL